MTVMRPVIYVETLLAGPGQLPPKRHVPVFARQENGVKSAVVAVVTVGRMAVVAVVAVATIVKRSIVASSGVKRIDDAR